MGILILPVYFIALVLWILCLVFFIKRSQQQRIASRAASMLLAPLFSALVYGWIIWDWSGQTKIWGLQPLFDLPVFMVILASIPGLIGQSIPVESRIPNIIGFALCFSVIISGPASVLLTTISPDALLTIDVYY